MTFADFQQNNNVFVKKKEKEGKKICSFKKYQPRGKFMFRKLAYILSIFSGITYLCKNYSFKKYHLRRKFIFRQFVDEILQIFNKITFFVCLFKCIYEALFMRKVHITTVSCEFCRFSAE